MVLNLIDSLINRLKSITLIKQLQLNLNRLNRFWFYFLKPV